MRVDQHFRGLFYFLALFRLFYLQLAPEMNQWLFL